MSRPARAWMRKALLAVVAAAALSVVVAVGGCTVSGSSTATDPRLDGSWRLVSASDSEGSLDVHDDNITLQVGEASGGISPCRKYSATVTGGVGVVYIRVDQPGGGADCSTRSLAALDKRYIRALTATDFASVTAHTLTLRSKSTTLVFTDTPPASFTGLTQTRWTLAELPVTARRSATDETQDGNIILTFSMDNTMKVSSPCSVLEERFALDGDNIVAVSSTVNISYGKPCSTAAQALDQDVRNLLLGTFSASLFYAAGDRGTSLEITNHNDGLTGLFRPAGT